MKKTLFTALALVMLVGVAIVLPLSSAHATESFQMETETRIYNPAKSYGGYFMPSNYDIGGAGNTSYLMDMEGHIVKRWPAIKGWAPYIEEDGTIWGGGYIHDWENGDVIWSFTTPPYMAHHGFRKMWNKKLNQWTMLLNCNRTMTQAEAVAMGMDPSVAYGSRLNGADFLAEVTIDAAKKIVWEWYPWHHGCQDKNAAWPNYVSDVKLAPHRYDVNWLTNYSQPAKGGVAGITSDWWHVNSVDYQDETGYIVRNEKNWSQFVVIDHDGTFVSATDFAANAAAAAGPAGDLLYRWGAPASYNSGEEPGFMTEGDNQMYGSHDIHWIKPYAWQRPHLATDTWPDPVGYTKSSIALPGAGNFLIYDNGCYNPTGMRSRILEINGRIGASGVEEVPLGQYVDPVVAGYKNKNAVYHPSKQLVWSFASQTQHSFYSSHISSCQRLPNGNTSVCAGNQGHFFEVTPSGEVVWEYLYPGIAGTAAMRLVNIDNGLNQCYRNYRYGADYPAFTGKTLVPGSTITGRVPRLVGSSDSYPPTVTYTGFGYGATGVAVGGGGGGGGGTGGGGGGGY